MDKIDGRYLRFLREKHGYSLREFADMIFVSKSSVQRWEKSFVPEYPEILTKISEVFNIPIDEIRRQSALKYTAVDGDDELSPEQLAELKFSAKKLIIPFIFLFGIIFIVTMLMLFI